MEPGRTLYGKQNPPNAYFKYGSNSPEPHESYVATPLCRDDIDILCTSYT